MDGHIVYRIDIQPFRYLTLPAIAYTPAKYPNGVAVDISSPDDHHVTIKVTFTGIATKGEATVIGMDIASTIADKLASEYGIKLSGPIEEKHHWVGQLTLSGAAITSFIAGCETTTVGPNETPALTTLLERDEPNRSAYRATLRFVMQCDDPVARFMLLYAMLYELPGQSASQAKVDTWLNVTFGVALPHTNPVTGKPMSEYTKLRNDIAHPPAGISLETTRASMEAEMDNLLRFVREAVRLVPA